jgi:SAM-dependent methyltransferase
MENKLSKIEELYTDNLKQFGVSSKGVGWPDENSHLLRFKKLVYLLPEESNPLISINDLGCGYGALYDYLKKNTIGFSGYNGFDISQEMLNKAKELINENDAEFILGSELNKTADYSFASGIFNVKFETDYSLWQKYFENVIDNMNEFSSKGFAFNCLSTYVDFKRDHLFYGDPLYFFNYCKNRYSRFVTLLHDYPLYEWTIIVKKG